MKRTSVGMMVLGMAVMGAGMARADLLVDPTVGNTTVLFGGTQADDQVASGRSLGFTGSFFGQSESTIDVSVNGIASFSGYSNYLNAALPYNTAVIAPLWDDQAVFASTSPAAGGRDTITESVVPGTYYAVTWDDSVATGTNSISSPHYRYQFVWFGGTDTIGSQTFQPNDIVFSYAEVDNGFMGGDATVGLNAGDGVHSAVGAGTNGLVTDPSSLPVNSSNAILFAPGSGGDPSYSVSVVNTAAAPEPASLLVLGASAGLLALRRRRSA